MSASGHAMAFDARCAGEFFVIDEDHRKRGLRKGEGSMAESIRFSRVFSSERR